MLRVDRSSGARTLVFSGPPLISPGGLDVAPDGRIYVAGQDTESGYASGVFRIDPESPAAASFVAIGDDTVAPIDRTDIVSATDVAIENASGPLYALDHVFSTGSSSDWAGIVAFVPGVSSAEGTHVTDPSAFYHPSGLAVVPEPHGLASAAASFLSVASLAALRARRAPR